MLNISMFFKILLASLLLWINPPSGATVDRIEDNNIVVLEVYHQRHIHSIDVSAEEFNEKVAEGDKLPLTVIEGSIEWLDGDDWYQFISYDNTVWWTLDTETIGFVPDADASYTLFYYDNGTTDCTDCPEEYECECEIYDDIFLGLKEN